MQRLSLFAGIAAVLACSMGVAWLARRYVTHSPRFAIKTVLVDGAVRLPAERVSTLAGATVGKNIFAVDLQTARVALLTDPWVEGATLTRKLPSTIRIEVAEREAVALAALDDALYLCTRDGEMFKRVAAGDPVDLPIVTGIASERVAADRAGAVEVVKRALDVAEMAKSVGATRSHALQEVHASPDGALSLVVGKDAIRIELGRGPYKEKLEQAARVLAEVHRRKANPAIVFVDNEAHPERVVVRMR